jgi:putative endonuclease
MIVHRGKGSGATRGKKATLIKLWFDAIYAPSFRGASPLRASPESITPVPAMAYYVYILASKKHGTLYVGVTNDIVRRGYEHRTKAVGGFTKRYDIDKLVWFEIYDDAISAIAREKELGKWRRDWKIRLIEEENPGWVDLYPGISS